MITTAGGDHLDHLDHLAGLGALSGLVVVLEGKVIKAIKMITTWPLDHLGCPRGFPILQQNFL